jgi:hypothetical protein
MGKNEWYNNDYRDLKSRKKVYKRKKTSLFMKLFKLCIYLLGLALFLIGLGII